MAGLALPVAVRVALAAAGELPLPEPLPPLAVVVAAPDAESDWVPLTDAAVALIVAEAVALPFPMPPPAGLPSALTVNCSKERLGVAIFLYGIR